MAIVVIRAFRFPIQESLSPGLRIFLALSAALFSAGCVEGTLRSEGSPCSSDKACGPGLYCAGSPPRCTAPPQADGATDADDEEKRIRIVSPEAGSFVGRRINVQVDLAWPSLVERIEILLDGHLVKTSAEALTAFDLELPEKEQGIHTLLATHRDRAGRLSSDKSDFYLDTEPPELEVFVSAGTEVGAPLVLTAACSDRSGVASIVASLQGAASVMPISEQIIGSGIRVFQFDRKSLTLGNYELVVVATDRVGLSSTKTASIGGVRLLSQPCMADLDCVTGFCAQGVCCESRCAGACEACNKEGAKGQCVDLPVAVGNSSCKSVCADDSDCAADYFCASGKCISDVTTYGGCGLRHFCAGHADNTVSCWGTNTNGQLGDGTDEDRFVPGKVVGLAGKIKQVQTGYYSSCALTEDGVVRCWGANNMGDLGVGSEVPGSKVPVELRFPAGTKVVQLGLGMRYGCARLDTGLVYCWGLNDFGQTGASPVSTPPIVWEPRLVAGLGPVDFIGVGWEHSCAKLRTGKLMCWGRNLKGALGDGSQVDSASPVVVQQRDALFKLSPFDASTVTSISAGSFQTCVVTSAGLAYCWGLNISGELCLGLQTPLEPFVTFPVRLNGLDLSFDQYQVGGGHSCGRLKATKEIACCGWNEFLQASTLNDNYHLLTPTKAIAERVATFATLGLRNPVTLENGALYFLGNNQDGGFGNGPPSGLVQAVKVLTAPTWNP